jgi:hypothetical protein
MLSGSGLPWPPLSPICRLYEPEAGLEAYGLEAASESATAFEYVWSGIKPMRPLDQWNSYMIQVWARGSTFWVKKPKQHLSKGFSFHRV